jgi:glycopeptide antibiotics resistance protein
MEKRKSGHKNLGILLLVVAFVVMLWQLVAICSSGMRHVTHGLLLIAGVCLPLALGTSLLSRSFAAKSDRSRVVRASFFALFVFYCVALIGALIISRVDYVTFAQTNADYWKHFDLMTNFHPLETVRLYLNAIRYNYIGMEIPLSNLIGNAMLFMPMAVFLPCLFRPMRKLWMFGLTMLLLLVAVEAAQLLLACGSCDVDDVLLNLSGTLILFGILKIPAIQRLLRRMRLLPEEPKIVEEPASAEVLSPVEEPESIDTTVAEEATSSAIE